MQRITLSIDDELAAALDRHMKKHKYASRSEALRDILRDPSTSLRRAAQARERLDEALPRKNEKKKGNDAGGGGAFCDATLAYIYDHAILRQAQDRRVI